MGAVWHTWPVHVRDALYVAKQENIITKFLLSIFFWIIYFIYWDFEVQEANQIIVKHIRNAGVG